jgi:hypothetical protein
LGFVAYIGWQDQCLTSTSATFICHLLQAIGAARRNR